MAIPLITPKDTAQGINMAKVKQTKSTDTDAAHTTSKYDVLPESKGAIAPKNRMVNSMATAKRAETTNFSPTISFSVQGRAFTYLSHPEDSSFAKIR